MAAARDDDGFAEVKRQTPQPQLQPQQRGDDFDSEMTDLEKTANLNNSSSSSGLALQRMSANNSHPFSNVRDDDDEDSSPLHPLMSRLQNRLLSRNTNLTRASSNKFDPLHPYTSILSLADVDQCVELENSAFPEHERCSREKVRRRVQREFFHIVFARQPIWSMVTCV
jgi:hypothetical protein